MSTFLEMQQRIADDLDRSDLTTQIKRAINRAIAHYETEPFWFKETSATFPAVSTQDEYIYGSGSVPSDVAMIDIMERSYGGKKVTMQEITPFELEAKQSLTAVGIPGEFAQYEDKFKLYPIPNQSGITIYLKYTKKYDELSADGDTNDWLTYAEDLIEARARWWINARILHDNDSAAADAFQEMSALDALRTKNTQKTGQGRVIPTGF